MQQNQVSRTEKDVFVSKHVNVRSQLELKYWYGKIQHINSVSNYSKHNQHAWILAARNFNIKVTRGETRMHFNECKASITFTGSVTNYPTTDEHLRWNSYTEILIA